METDRRGFLKGAIMAAAGVAVAPLVKLTEPTKVVPVEPDPKPLREYSRPRVGRAIASGDYAGDYFDITMFSDVNQTYLLRKPR